MDRLRGSLAFFLCGLLSAPSLPASAQTAPAPAHTRQPYQSGELQADDRILQALNRFTFGPRPGDLEAVRAMGLEKWFAQQLRPETIDNSSLEARLAQFPAMQWSTQDLIYRLPSPGIIRQAAEGKIPIPGEGALHAVYVDEIDRYDAKQRLKGLSTTGAFTGQVNQAANAAPPIAPRNSQQAGMSPDPRESMAATADPGQMMVAATQSAPDLPAFTDAQVASLLALPAQQRVARLVHMRQPEFDSFRKSLKGPQRFALDAGLNPAQKEAVLALENPQRVVSDELIAQRLTRDIYSNTQLEEVMTDFWLNHFNVYLHKNGETPYYLSSYVRDIVRPRALGKFEDLLKATAHSPAMLIYLDNSSSIGPDSAAAEKAKIAAARRPDAKRVAPQGLNENYARELMELHTLGVNGGYTQADVTQVARVLTGWTVDHPEHGGAFKFDDTRHEPGAKKVLGKKIKEHGEQEGEQLLHLLATRPATARFISYKLAIRFVGDDPPQVLVDRMAKSYLGSDGDISSVLKTLFHSPELWSPGAYRAKVKTPLEFVVSAARASRADIQNLQPLATALRDMGMPVYGAVPPTGYKWDASDWVSTGALVNRMNFALTLAANRLPGIAVDWSQAGDDSAKKVDAESAVQAVAQGGTGNPWPQPAPSPETEEQRLESLLVDGGISPATRAAVLDQFVAQFNAQIQPQGAPRQAPAMQVSIAAKPFSPPQGLTALEKQDQLLAGLLLGSPEFQRR